MKNIYYNRLDQYHFTFLPIISGTKSPSVAAWAEFNHRRPTEAEQAELLSRPSESLAILVGKPYGLVVLDVDSLDSLPLLAQLGEIPNTLCVKTHRGYHYYFKCVTFPKFSQKSRRVPNVELKHNGYVVAPGSVHPEGTTYEIVTYPADGELPTLPEWISNLFLANGDRSSSSPSRQLVIDSECKSLADLTTLVSNAEEGSRNNTLYLAAKALYRVSRTQGIAEEHGVDALLQASSLPESEAVRTIQSGLRNGERLKSRQLDYFFPEVEIELLRNWHQLDPSNFGQSQDGMANWLCALYGKFIRFDHTVGRWYIWSGNVWEPDETMAIRRIFSDAVYLREEATNARRDADGKQDDVDKTYQFLKSMKTLSAIKAVIEIAQSLVPIKCKNSDWDRDPDLFCVQNGVVHLPTKTLLPARPDQMISRIARFEYHPDSTAEMWKHFINEVTLNDESYQLYLRKVSGYSISGRTNARAFFMLYGSTTNGKSVFLDTLKYVIGSYASNTAWETFDYEQRNSHSQSLARLEGVRMVSVGEGSRESRWNMGRIKSITGNEDLTARDMYKSDRTFKPVCKLWFQFNSRPSLMDDSAAFWQRAIMMPFNASFENRKIIGIEDMLKDEGNAVLRWLIDGAHDYYLQKDLRVGMPEVVVKETEDYKNESEPLFEFLEECCVIEESKQGKSSDIIRAYTDFCNGRGRAQHQRLSDRTLIALLKKRFSVKKAADANYYLGLCLKVRKDGW